MKPLVCAASCEWTVAARIWCEKDSSSCSCAMFRLSAGARTVARERCSNEACKRSCCPGAGSSQSCQSQSVLSSPVAYIAGLSGIRWKNITSRRPTYGIWGSGGAWQSRLRPCRERDERAADAHGFEGDRPQSKRGHRECVRFGVRRGEGDLHCRLCRARPGRDSLTLRRRSKPHRLSWRIVLDLVESTFLRHQPCHPVRAWWFVRGDPDRWPRDRRGARLPRGPVRDRDALRPHAPQ